MPIEITMERIVQTCPLLTVRKSNMAMENGPFIGDVPAKTPIHRGFVIAMFDYQRGTSI